MADKPTPPAVGSAASSTSLSASTLTVAKRFWATAFVRGVLFLIIGLLMFFWPNIAFNLTKWLLIILFVMQAILLAVEGSRQSKDDTDGQLWRYLLALIAVGVGIALLVWPSSTIRIALKLVAVWALISGVIGVVSALRRFRARKPAWDWELTTSLLWVIFGVMVLVKSLDDPVAVTAALSVYLTVTGVVLLVAAWSLRVYKHDAATASSAAPVVPADQPTSGFADTPGLHAAPTAPIPVIRPTAPPPGT